MPNDNEKNLNNNIQDANLNESVNVASANDGIIDLDANIQTDKKVEKKNIKKAAKKSPKKKEAKKEEKKNVGVKQKVSTKTTKKPAAKKTITKVKTKSTSRITKQKKASNLSTASTKKNSAKSIEDELLKVTNIKSVEQVKKPKKIALMISFYSIIVLAILVFCLIKFSKPKRSDLLLEESINYDFLTEKIETTSRIIVESSSENDEEVVFESQSDSVDIRDRLTELTTKSIDSYNTESTKRISEVETTKQTETTKNGETTKKSETTKQVETTKKSETTKQVETTEQIVTKVWPKGNNVNEILPRYKEVIYPYSVYNQMSMEEIGIVNSALGENYKAVENKIFGEDVSFDTKGANGIIYLNYSYLKQYLEEYTSNNRQVYDQLPVAPYYNYIMNDKFKFNYQTYTTNLSMRLDFKNAKSKGAYFEIPATIIEPKDAQVSENGIYKTLVRVLKKAKVGYTESFSLSALLEVLDIECHTKHNPFFDVDEIIGLSPKVVNDMRESGFDVRSMLDDDAFNYVLFDKKGYITALYMLKS